MYLPPFVFSVIFQHVFSAVCQLALLLGSVRNILPVSVKMKMTGPHNPTQQTTMCGNCKNTGHTLMKARSELNDYNNQDHYQNEFSVKEKYNI